MSLCEFMIVAHHSRGPRDSLLPAQHHNMYISCMHVCTRCATSATCSVPAAALQQKAPTPNPCTPAAGWLKPDPVARTSRVNPVKFCCDCHSVQLLHSHCPSSHPPWPCHPNSGRMLCVQQPQHNGTLADMLMASCFPAPHHTRILLRQSSTTSVPLPLHHTPTRQTGLPLM